ncbi:MAG: L,D-transpeptidase family protein, partial [Alloalcanivorax venustensis]
MHIHVSLSDQTLTLESPEDTLRFPVSTAAVGAGERHGSGATPRGRHLVRARFGAGLPAGAVFAGRRFHGELYDAEQARRAPE